MRKTRRVRRKAVGGGRSRRGGVQSTKSAGGGRRSRRGGDPMHPDQMTIMGLKWVQDDEPATGTWVPYF